MLNISFRYHTVFTFRILHDYYHEELSTDLVMIPSFHSSKKIKRTGMVLKQSDRLLRLLYEEEKKDMLFSLSSEDLTFSFFIYSKNFYFHNFTQLPIEVPSDKLLYFSNKNKTASSQLNQTDFVTEQDYIDRSEIKEPFPSGHSAKRPIAFVEISLAGLFGENITSGSAEELIYPEYFIRFAARRTYWKYAIVAQNRKLDHHVQIVPGDGPAASFTRKENEVLLNKQEAAIFVSDEPLLLKQRTEYAFKLTQKDKVSKVLEIIPRLPVPSIEMIKPESRQPDARIYSEVVIYI